MKKSNSSRGKFMKVSTSLLDVIDYRKPYQMQLAITILYKAHATYIIWDETNIQTTPELLINTFKNQDISRQGKKNIIEALNDMRDRGLIKFDGDITFQSAMYINAEPLLKLSDNKPYVELLISDFYSIMQSDNIIKFGEKEKSKDGLESFLLQSFLIVKARWNFKTIDYLATFGNEVSYYIDTDRGLQEATGAFCSDTLDFIRTHKHYDLDEVDDWCDDRYLTAYLEKLEELGCIKIYKRKMKSKEGNWTKRNFYYVPTMSFNAIQAMVKQYAKRNNYAIMEQEQSVKLKPVKDIKSSRKDIKSSRKRERTFD